MLLGHRTLSVTQVYAQRNVEQAIRVAQRIAPFRPTWFETPVPPQNISAMVEGHDDVVEHLEERVDTTRNSGPTQPGATTGAVEGATDTYTAKITDNPAAMGLNQFAAKTLPTVQHHLTEARTIQDRLGNRRNTTN